MDKIYDPLKCACGKSKTYMNFKNWTRHLKACKYNNFRKGAQNIKSFLTIPENKSDLEIGVLTG